MGSTRWKLAVGRWKLTGNRERGAGRGDPAGRPRAGAGRDTRPRAQGQGPASPGGCLARRLPRPAAAAPQANTSSPCVPRVSVCGERGLVGPRVPSGPAHKSTVPGRGGQPTGDDVGGGGCGQSERRRTHGYTPSAIFSCTTARNRSRTPSKGIRCSTSSKKPSTMRRLASASGKPRVRR